MAGNASEHWGCRVGRVGYFADMQDSVLSSLLWAQLRTLRRTLHATAELSGREARTAHTIAEFLGAHGPDRVYTGLAGHGVVAIFEGVVSGPTVLLRCELDALPRDHADDVSEGAVGAVHRCGHDGHMSMIAGLAAVFSARRPARGRVVLVFQPAEETGDGAAAMLADPRMVAIAPDYALALPTARKTGRYLMRTEESGPIRIDATRSDRVRGISDSVCREVGEGLHLAQDDGPRGLDWRPAQQDEAGWRWSGPNPSPKLQINAVATGPVTLQIDLLALAEHGFPPFEVTLNGTPTPYDLGPVTRMKRFSFSRLSMTTSLKTTGPSILGFRFVTPESPGRMAGVAIGPIRIDPVPPQKMKSSAE